MIGLHALVLMKMLGAERMIFAEDYSHRKQNDGQRYKPYNGQNPCHLRPKDIHCTNLRAKVLLFLHICKFFLLFAFFSCVCAKKAVLLHSI